MRQIVLRTNGSKTKQLHTRGDKRGSAIKITPSEVFYYKSKIKQSPYQEFLRETQKPHPLDYQGWWK
jgi:hypothetical protein